VRQTVEDYRNIIDTNGLKVLLDVPDHPVWIEGDPTRLLQVVGNLLHNANKFSHAKGLIRVAVVEEDGPNGKMVRVSVSDSGIGIDPAMLGHVFDVFRQADQGLDRSRGGLGLGLALVKGLVQLHMGTVEALSEGHNQGAEFRIRLPLAAAEVATAAVPGDETAATKPLRVLLIEDNVDAAESASLLLRHEGHEVETAFDAEAGLAAAYRFKPDVILCDIGLPGMDGYQIIRKIREDAELKPIYVVALTGYGRETDRNQALSAGFDLHLTKPIDWPTLTATLGRARPRKMRKTAVVA
jgi:CheY-like chemotaxis protein